MANKHTAGAGGGTAACSGGENGVPRLLWLDMEMTGLDVEKEVPIEVACIVTDWQFQPQTHYHAIIKQPQEYLDRMDDWNREHHQKSGLTDQIPNGKAPETVEQELCQL